MLTQDNEDPIIKQLPPKRAPSSLAYPPSVPPQVQKTESFGSETDSSDSEQANNADSKNNISTDHKDWEKLNVSSEIKDIFQYILR